VPLESGIRKKLIPDLGGKKALGPGSGTLVRTTENLTLFYGYRYFNKNKKNYQ
jgi:hypothetical protein